MGDALREASPPQRTEVAPPSERPTITQTATGTRSARPTAGPVSVRRQSQGDIQAEGSTDRRAAPRARYATLVRIVVGDRKLDGRTDTISPSGVSMIVPEGAIPALPGEGTHGVVRFALPLSEATVSLQCTIVRESPHPRGGRLLELSFTLVSFEVEQEIHRYVDAVGTVPSDPPPIREG